MEKNRKTSVFIGVLYTMITVMLILLGFIYTVSF